MLGNVIKAINKCAVPALRFTAGIVKLTQADLEKLDRKIRKIINNQPCTAPYLEKVDEE